MKKSLRIALLFLIVMLPLTAQTALADFEAGFTDFSDAIADSLPFNASIGQQWSDAYIGEFPHMGIGVSIGATTIPYTAIKPVLDLFSLTLPSNLAFLVDYGVPVPAYSIDARLGFPVIPLDIGVKFGMIPEEAKLYLPVNIAIDYLLLGVDLRFALLKDKLQVPAVSVGVGYNYLHGTLGVADLFGGVGQTIDIPDGHTIGFTDPNLNFYWDTTVINLKLQVSKNLFIITPFAVLDVAYGMSTAGGGLASDIEFDGAPITADDIAFVNALLGSAAPDLTDQVISVASAADGWALSLFGGIGLNLMVLRIDTAFMFNFTSKAYGAVINLRIQL